MRRLPAALLVLLLAGALLSGTPLTGVDPGPAVADPVIRIPGTDPIALPVAVSNAVVADHSTDTVLLGDVNDVTHALGAAAATGQLPTPAPLLFTPATALDPAVSSEIDRVLPSPATASSKVYLLGPGFTAGGPVETALTTRGVTVDHVSGATPADTAALLANRLLPTGGVDRTVLLVPPTDPLAAAAAGAWGANRALPVLLAGTSDVLPPATLRYITETAATTVVLIGSRTAIGLGQQHSLEDRGVTVRRASGTDSENLATQVAQSWANPTLVTGTALAPVLVGPAGPASAALASPLLSAAKAAVGIRAPLLIVPTTGTADPRSDCDRSDGRGTPCYLLGAAPGPMTVVGDASLVSDAGVATLDAARSSGRDTYVPNFSHVFVVVFENKNYNDIFGPGGRANAPYLNSLLASGAQSTQFYGVTHNSQPNYLALVGGITPTATTQQDCPQYNCIYGPEVRHIGDQLEAAGRTWKGYMDGMKSPCQRPAPEGAGDQYFLQGVPPGNTYATRHNPWMYLRNVVGDQARCNLHDVPYPQLVTDVATGHVPDFSLIVPDLCHDGHDSDQQCTALSGSRGGIAGIDSWAAQELPRILTSPTYQDGGLLVVTFDESENDNTGCCLTPAAPGGGRVGTIVLSPSWGREAGFEDPTPYNQYNLLHTIETGWGLGPVGVSGDSRAYQMSLLFRRPAAAGGSGPVNPPGGGGTPGGTGSPPATPSQWLFAEGTTRPGFTEYLSLANPSVTTNTATITYFTTAAGTGAVNPAKTSTHVLAPQSRTTVAVNDAGEAGPDVDVSTLVTVAGPGSETVVAERPLYFHGVFAFAATDGSDVVGARAPAREWWFAEGTTRPGFQEYLTLENPGPATNAHIEFTTRDPATGASTVITRPAVPLPAESRTTIDVNRSDQAGPAVDVSTRVTADGPIVVERPQYFSTPIGLAGAVDGGHDVVGALAPSLTWSFAEGTTRPGFQEYLTVQNPSTQPAAATLEYQFGNGQSKTVPIVFDPRSRTTIDVDDPAHAGLGQDVSVRVTADQAIVVERPLYFGAAIGAVGPVTGGTDVVGQASSGFTWLLAEGTTRPGFQEYVTIQNAEATAVDVQVTYLRRDAVTGAASPLTLPMTLAPHSRTTIDVAEVSQAGPNQDVSTVVAANGPIAVERPLYFSGVIDGTIKGGHDSFGVSLT